MTSSDEPVLPGNWEQLAPLVDQLLDAPQDQRASLLAALSAGNPARQAELERLVAECERDLPLLNRPAVERFDQLLGDEPGPALPDVLGGRYRIERELGRGGMACVYLAEDLKHARHVAVKVIRPELTASLGRDRFLREIGIAARLRHPNIMPLYDSGDADGVLYFVMPYEDGPSLRTRLERGTGLPIQEAISILRDVARALAYAHEQGVVHRDVKPDNVMVSGGAAVVTDFGIAKAFSAALTESGAEAITQIGSVIGTPAYMAPEQGMGDPATDHRADLYSFGCLAYELLTGKPPFTGSTTFQVVAAQMAVVPKPVTESRAEVPSAVAGLIARCLAKDPAARPQTAHELLDVLGGASTVDQGRMPRRRRPAAVLATIIGMSAMVVAGAWYSLRPGGPVTVSVMLFGSVGGDSTQANLAEGFSDEIATALQRVPWIRVMSQWGVSNYRGQGNVSYRETGKALGAKYLVMGSISTIGGETALIARMISSETGSVAWAERFDGLTDLAALRDRIAMTIGDSLRPLAGRKFRSQVPDAAPTHRGTSASYQLYVLGKEKLNRRNQDIGASIELFRDAVALDSLSAQAYSGLSLALALVPRFQQLSPAPFIVEATTAAQRALLLNPRLSEPHVALGMLLEYALEWDRAESEFKSALELDRHNVEARIQYGAHLRIRGRLAESARQMEMAREDDPASAVVASHLSWAWYLNGQVDSALAESARARRIDASNFTAVSLGALVLLGAGQAEAAHSLILRLPSRNYQALYVLAATGDRATALGRLQVLESTHPPPPHVHTARALAMFGLGDTAQALNALERAIDAKEIWYWGGVPSGPVFAGVRDSPRFRALLTRVGLSQQ